ncbi:sulfotransferase family protein, partial [Candidatus Parcubacteria bacterium]
LLAARRDDHMEAERLLVQAINQAPRRVDLYENLGSLYISRNVPDAAEEVYRKALTLNPTSFKSKLGVAVALVRQRKGEDALPILLELKKRHPNEVEVLQAIFLALEQMDRYQEAFPFLEKAIAIAPENTYLRELRALASTRKGDFELARKDLEYVLASEPDHPRAWSALSRIIKFQRDDPKLFQLDRAFENSPEDSPARVYLAFASAKAMEDVGEYDEAFARYAEGNAIRHRHLDGYNLDAELAHLQAVMEYWAADAFASTSGLTDERPVFIVGLPRCGSTLTEQILSAHPLVASRGEWNAFEGVLLAWQQRTGTTITLEDMTGYASAQWAEIGRLFLNRLDEGEQALRITDKTLNTHRLLGAIHCALPKAKIIHVRRHPLDHCLGMFRANFRGGEFDFVYSLRGIGYYYRMYARLMRHWASVLPEGTMLEVRYEDLVREPEREVRRMIDFLGLPWDEACLDFSRARTIVRTSSVAQVREGMRKDYMQRWKRYEKHLEPLKRILKDELAAWPE